jgi:hypothetical protein
VELLTFGGVMLSCFFIIHVLLYWDLFIWSQVIGWRF